MVSMAEDADAEPEGPADKAPQPFRQPDYRKALPAPRHSSMGRQLAPPAPEVRAEDGHVPEPPEDLIVSPGFVYVTVEIPGAAEGTIVVEAADARLSIAARRRDGSRYRREVDLPEPVDPKAVRAECRNGVLDVTIRRGTPRDRAKEPEPHV